MVDAWGLKPHPNGSWFKSRCKYLFYLSLFKITLVLNRYLFLLYGYKYITTILLSPFVVVALTYLPDLGIEETCRALISSLEIRELYYLFLLMLPEDYPYLLDDSCTHHNNLIMDSWYNPLDPCNPDSTTFNIVDYSFKGYSHPIVSSGDTSLIETFSYNTALDPCLYRPSILGTNGSLNHMCTHWLLENLSTHGYLSNRVQFADRLLGIMRHFGFTYSYTDLDGLYYIRAIDYEYLDRLISYTGGNNPSPMSTPTFPSLTPTFPEDGEFPSPVSENSRQLLNNDPWSPLMGVEQSISWVHPF
jgi:hypothetical protein